MIKIYVIHAHTRKPVYESDGGIRSFDLFVPLRIDPPPDWAVYVGLMLTCITTDTKWAGYEPLFYVGRADGHLRMIIKLPGTDCPLWPPKEFWSWLRQPWKPGS